MEKGMLLEAYLKRLRLPAIGRHYQELARQAAQGNLPYEAFLLALVEIEAQQREENAHQKRLRMARFPVLRAWTSSTSRRCPPSTRPGSWTWLREIIWRNGRT